MLNNCRNVLCVSLLLTSTGYACGPDFPETVFDRRADVMKELPSSGFYFEAARLLPRDKDNFGTQNGGAETDENGLSALEKVGLSAEQIKLLLAMQLADTSNAMSAGEGLPKDVQLYKAGARSFHAGDLDAAANYFRAVMALPEAERSLRSTWASFMLGRLAAIDGDDAQALEKFVQVRALANSGFADAAGLAVESFGEQARLTLHSADLKQFHQSLSLYAQQAAHGHAGGAASLLFIARDLVSRWKTLDPLWLNDPLVRQLLAAYAFTRSGEFGVNYSASSAENGEALPVSQGAAKSAKDVLMVLAQGSKSAFPGSDRLAASAYNEGQFELADRLSAMGDEPLDHWVQAKLALRANKPVDAAKHFAAASKAFPQQQIWTTQNGERSEYGSPNEEINPRCRVQAEAAVLALSRADYVAAMEQLFAASPAFWSDAAFVAERVLTTAELRQFVDKNVPPHVLPEVKMPRNDEDYDNKSTWTGIDDSIDAVGPATTLRVLLARRMLRDGLGSEALVYFDLPERRAKAKEYLAALARGLRGDDLDRAEGLLAAAKIARADGMEILGMEGDPDFAVWDGNYGAAQFEYDENGQEIAVKPHDLDLGLAYVGIDEASRVRASAAVPLERYHYRYLASTLAQRAADLLPRYSQAFAVSLCRAAHYVQFTAPADARKIYQRYLREGPYVAWGGQFAQKCPEPDFGKLKNQIHERKMRHYKWLLKRYAPIAAGAIVLLVAGFWLVRRRRVGKA
jgi:cellulose synthase operon protein C